MTTDTSSQEPSHPFFATVYDPATALIERTLLRPHREYLVADLEGAVLDLGAGTGAMFPYFAAVESEVTTFHAIEPDPHMRRQAEEQSRTHSLDVTIDDSPAELLPYRDDTFDVVTRLCTFISSPDFCRLRLYRAVSIRWSVTSRACCGGEYGPDRVKFDDHRLVDHLSTSTHGAK